MKRKRIGCALIILSLLLLSACDDSGGGGTGSRIYRVIYEGNHSSVASETVPVDERLYAEGETVTVLGPGSMAREGYAFLYWNTAANGSGTNRLAGATFRMGNTDVSLYAIWSSNVASVDIVVTDGTGVEIVLDDSEEDVGIIVDDGEEDVDVVVDDGDEDVDIVVDDSDEDVEIIVDDGDEDVEVIVDDDTGEVDVEIGD